MGDPAGVAVVRPGSQGIRVVGCSNGNINSGSNENSINNGNSNYDA